MPGFTSFNLYSEEGNSFIAGIKSGDKDGEKMLSLVLLTTGETAVPVEDGRNMVVLATRLYGGFEEETCVYDQFQKEFPTFLQRKVRRICDVFFAARQQSSRYPCS